MKDQLYTHTSVSEPAQIRFFRRVQGSLESGTPTPTVLLQMNDIAALTLFDVPCKFDPWCMGCRRSEEEPLPTYTLP
jgi:hypothetical protein